VGYFNLAKLKVNYDSPRKLNIWITFLFEEILLGDEVLSKASYYI